MNIKKRFYTYQVLNCGPSGALMFILHYFDFKYDFDCTPNCWRYCGPMLLSRTKWVLTLPQFVQKKNNNRTQASGSDSQWRTEEEEEEITEKAPFVLHCVSILLVSLLCAVALRLKKLWSLVFFFFCAVACIRTLLFVIDHRRSDSKQQIQFRLVFIQASSLHINFSTKDVSFNRFYNLLDDCPTKAIVVKSRHDKEFGWFNLCAYSKVFASFA